MIENLFRGKRKDNGEWIEGNLLILDGEEYRIATSCLPGDDVNLLIVCAYEVIPETVGQFTGVLDKKKTEIFSGDIVRLCRYAFEWDKENWNFEIGVIEFENGCFVINDICSSDGYNELSCMFDELCCGMDDYDDHVIFEVVGNIYDNPELLSK